MESKLSALFTFSVGNLTEAARCAGTHSYMMPGDEQMLTNVEYYKASGVGDQWFVPRPEAMEYVHRKGVIILFNCRYWMCVVDANSIYLNNQTKNY